MYLFTQEITLEWNKFVDTNIDAEAIYTPVDIDFPVNRILAIVQFYQPQWLSVEIYLAEIAEVRNNGQVYNDRDWPLQNKFIN